MIFATAQDAYGQVAGVENLPQTGADLALVIGLAVLLIGMGLFVYYVSRTPDGR